ASVVRGLPPDFDREAGTIPAFTARIRILDWIARRIVDVVVVPAPAAPLIALIASMERDVDRACAGEVRGRLRSVVVAVVQHEARVIGPRSRGGSKRSRDSEGRRKRYRSLAKCSPAVHQRTPRSKRSTKSPFGV